MKKRILWVIFFSLIGIVLLQLKKDHTKATSKKSSEKIITTPLSPLQETTTERPVLISLSGIKELNKNSKRLPSYSTDDFESVTQAGLPDGYKLLLNVFAVKKESSRDIQKKIIGEARGYVFFQSESGKNGANVVIDESTGKLYPLSAIIKLRKIDEGLRDVIISKGYEEHFYHTELKLMYLQSNHEDLLSLFDELKKQGLNPELEIIRAYHRPR